jgi:hypothetical protein
MLKRSVKYFVLAILIASMVFSCTAAKEIVRVCGTNFNQKILEYTAGKGWKEEGDNILSKVTIDNNGDIYGIGSYGNIIFIDQKKNWNQIIGDMKFRKITAGNGKLCGISSNGSGYIYNKESKVWDPLVEKKLVDMDLSINGTIWIIDGDGNIAYSIFNSETGKYGDWQIVAKAEELISEVAGVDGNNAWGIGETGTLYRYGAEKDETGKETGNKTWSAIQGEKLRSVDVDSAGKIWAITEDGYAFRYDPAAVKKENMWVKFNVQLAEISAGGSIIEKKK